MNLLIDFNREACRFQAEELMPLSWVAFAIESCALWYLGRCQWQLSFARMRGSGDTVQFYVAPLRPGGMVASLTWANYTPIKNLGTAFPARLLEPWAVRDERDGTLIQAEGPSGEATLGFMGYWIGDGVTDLFLRGAVNARAQFSRDKIQLYGNVSLSPERFAELTDPEVRDYEPGQHVANLPWPA